MRGKLIAVMGTNASGKSGLGVELALRCGGEIVSADSRQVFRGLDLGSGKITQEEMRGVPHHLIDVCAPGDFFSMADFQRLAYAAIDDILSRGRLPFLVGGTGLYVDAVADGYELSDRAPDLRLREHLETFDTPALYDMLKEKLPDTEIDPKNRNRVMRALERLAADDYHPGKRAPRYDVLKLGVTWPREILKQRIDQRLEARLQAGMVEEVRALLASGVPENGTAMQAIGYKETAAALRGECSPEEAAERIKQASRRYAKRQLSWLRRDPDLHWILWQKEPKLEKAGALSTRILEESGIL